MTARAPTSSRGLGILFRLGGILHGHVAADAAVREADAALRESVATELDATRDGLDRLIVTLSGRGVLAYLADLESLKRQLAACANALRRAPAPHPDEGGGSGVRFQLDRMYRLDLHLRELSRKAAASARALSARSWAGDIAGVREHVEDLRIAVAERAACGAEVGSGAR